MTVDFQNYFDFIRRTFTEALQYGDCGDDIAKETLRSLWLFLQGVPGFDVDVSRRADAVALECVRLVVKERRCDIDADALYRDLIGAVGERDEAFNAAWAQTH